MTTGQFQEIAHSGGKITIRVDAQSLSYQLSYTSNRASGQMKLICIYALAQGIPVCRIDIGGIGSKTAPPPFPGCYMVMIGSDSEGWFGHHCQTCDGYWRSGPWPNLCPYCRHRDDSVNFLSEAQRRYVAHYCTALNEALNSGQNGEYTIDMDAVADAAGKEGEKPAFYVSEESQQYKFGCGACGEDNDVIGRFAYCCVCGTRNDAALFTRDITALRARVGIDDAGNIVRDAISAFDNTVGQYVKQLVAFVPLSARRAALLQRRFHDLEATTGALKECFDIALLDDMANRIAFLRRLFLRRHIYEHNGGEADQTYLDKSGDATVRLKEHLSETPADLHQLLGDLDRMTRSLHDRFHELMPPLEEPIAAHRELLERRKTT